MFSSRSSSTSQKTWPASFEPALPVPGTTTTVYSILDISCLFLRSADFVDCEQKCTTPLHSAKSSPWDSPPFRLIRWFSNNLNGGGRKSATEEGEIQIFARNLSKIFIQAANGFYVAFLQTQSLEKRKQPGRSDMPPWPLLLFSRLFVVTRWQIPDISRSHHRQSYLSWSGIYILYKRNIRHWQRPY